MIESGLNKDNFSLWMPVEVTKGTTVSGDEKWGFKGIASTTKRDTDNEVLMPQGFDLSYFTESGLVNWNHQSKDNPSAIIGEPTLAKVVPDGLYVETELYKTPTAKGVWELAKAMSKKKRKLGFSIEGKVLERDPLDATKITKAKITGLAITPTPKNNATFAEMVKGGSFEFDDDEDVNMFQKAMNKEDKVSLVMREFAAGKLKDSNGNIVTDRKQALAIAYSEAENIEKTMSTANAGMLGKESVTSDHVKEGNNKVTLTKSEVYDHIFQNVTTDIIKADKIFKLINHHNTRMGIESNQGVSLDAIEKALASIEAITKGENTTAIDGNGTLDGNANGVEVNEVAGLYKSVASDNMKKCDYIAKGKKWGYDDDTCEKGYNAAIEKGFVKPDPESAPDETKDKKKEDDDKKLDEVKKSIVNEIGGALSGVSDILKSLNTELQSLRQQNAELIGRMEKVEAQPQSARRSVQSAGWLEKGQVDELNRRANADGRRTLDLANVDDTQEIKKGLESKAYNDNGVANPGVAQLLASMEISQMHDAIFRNKGQVGLIEKALDCKLVDSSNRYPHLNI